MEGADIKATFYLALTMESFYLCCLSNVKQGQMMLTSIASTK